MISKKKGAVTSINQHLCWDFFCHRNNEQQNSDACTVTNSSDQLLSSREITDNGCNLLPFIVELLRTRFPLSEHFQKNTGSLHKSEKRHTRTSDTFTYLYFLVQSILKRFCWQSNERTQFILIPKRVLWVNRHLLAWLGKINIQKTSFHMVAKTRDTPAT